MNSSELDKVLFENYAYIAGLACSYELQVRLEADANSNLSKYSHEKDFNVLEEKFLEHYAEQLKSEESALLVNARQLRNKIIHSDFKSASSKVQEAGGTISATVVHKLNLHTSKVKKISETTKKEGGIFGWFLEVSSNGTMRESEILFKQAIQIVRRIGLARATKEI